MGKIVSAVLSLCFLGLCLLCSPVTASVAWIRKKYLIRRFAFLQAGEVKELAQWGESIIPLAIAELKKQNNGHAQERFVELVDLVLSSGSKYASKELREAVILCIRDGDERVKHSAIGVAALIARNDPALKSWITDRLCRLAIRIHTIRPPEPPIYTPTYFRPASPVETELPDGLGSILQAIQRTRVLSVEDAVGLLDIPDPRVFEALESYLLKAGDTIIPRLARLLQRRSPDKVIDIGLNRTIHILARVTRLSPLSEHAPLGVRTLFDLMLRASNIDKGDYPSLMNELWLLNFQCIPELKRRLKCPSYQDAFRLCSLVQKIPSYCSSLSPELFDLLESENKDAAFLGAITSAAVGVNKSRSLEVLSEALKSEEDFVRIASLRALRKVKALPREIITQIQDLLDRGDTDEDVRTEALDTSQVIHPDGF